MSVLDQRRAFTAGLVSIIIPVYNNRALLPEAISSCCAQTYENIEVLVIDDGSTDGLNERAVLSIGCGVSYTSIPNQGPGLARNIGVSRANGEFIFFLDSDDLLPPVAIAELVSAIGDRDFVVGMCERVFISKAGQISARKVWKEKIFLRNPGKLDLITDILSTNKLYRTAFLEAAGLSFTGGDYEDLPFVCKLYEASDNFAVLKKVVYTWQVRENLESRSSTLSVGTLASRVDVLHSCIMSFQDEEMKKAFIENAIKHDLKRYVNICRDFTPQDLDVLYDIYHSFVTTYRDYLDPASFKENRSILLAIDDRNRAKAALLQVSTSRNSRLKKLMKRFKRLVRLVSRK
jgi:CDP-glycerol glycerophosphotransferase